MKRISSRWLFVVVCIGTAWLVSAYTRKTAVKMNSFRWVIGTWESPRKAGIMRESWQVADDSSFVGTSVMLKTNGGSQLLEKMQLTFRHNVYYFTSEAGEQNDGKAISFRIDDYSDKHFEAINLQHDFPKRIIYRLSGPDSLFARIDGGPSAPEQKVDFHFKRKE
jgi:hypothetical protein